MSDFQFLRNKVSKAWVILAPKRAKRPDFADGSKSSTCPFCVGNEANDEVYRLPEGKDPWKVRVVKNKYPFAPIHEIVVLSPSHSDSFGNLPRESTEDILTVYRHRYNEHSGSGQVVIFHNCGHEAGESLPHPHSQITAVPFEVNLRSPELKSGLEGTKKRDQIQTKEFAIFTPLASEWPDEVWVAPIRSGKTFGEISDSEISDLASVLKKLISLMEHRHDGVFPYNFYIYSGEDWYLRIIPRLKRIGGFEFATNIFVNTQDPKETMEFLKAHFKSPDLEKIRKHHRADYHKTA